MANAQGWQSWCTTGWIWGGVLRWITMHYIGGCGEMDNIVLRSATSPSCKMRCGDGFRCTTLVDVGRWTTLYYDPQPFCKMRCGETTCMTITIWRNYNVWTFTLVHDISCTNSHWLWYSMHQFHWFRYSMIWYSMDQFHWLWYTVNSL